MKDLRALDVRFEVPCVPNPSYHPGRAADVYVGARRIGVLGQVHPLVARNYGVDADFYCAELDFGQLLDMDRSVPEYVPLPSSPRHPGHRRGVRRGRHRRGSGGLHPQGAKGL